MSKKRYKSSFIACAALLVLMVSVFGGFSCFQRPAQHDIPKLDNSKKHIACIGDSITYSYMSTDPLTKGYPAQLQNLVGDEYQVLNYGICGATGRAFGDLPYIFQLHYIKSLLAKADIYIIMLGTNDSKPQNWDAAKYERDYTNLIKSYKNLSNHPQVYILRPPVVYDEPGLETFDIRNDVIENEILPIVDRIGANLGVPVIDLNELTKNHLDWYADNVHPNDLGYEAIANQIYNNIQW